MLFKKKSVRLMSPCDGEAVPLSEIPDEVFSKGILGLGLGIRPKNGIIVSPCDGTVEVVSGTLHAYTVKSDDGAQIIIHIGVDTVELEGEGFKSFVKEGQRISRGDVICHADLGHIQSKGLKTEVAMVIVNSEIMDKIKYVYGYADGGKTSVMQYERRA